MMIRTKQEVFEISSVHLVKQNRKATETISGRDQCRYRAADGSMCAVGCMIPDEEYREEFEGYSVSGIGYAVCEKIRAAAGITQDTADLAGRLQTIHDCGTPDTWRNRLKELAKEYNLNTDAMDAVPIPDPVVDEIIIEEVLIEVALDDDDDDGEIEIDADEFDF